MDPLERLRQYPGASQPEEVQWAIAEIERLTGANLHLRQTIAYMDDHADSPTIIRREARRALERKE
jgi:uncharacterized protein YciW